MIKQPSKDDIEFWLNLSKELIEEDKKRKEDGFYKKNNVSIQSVLHGSSSEHAFLARALFLNGSPIEEVRTNYITAARYIIKAMKIAFDKDDPDYLGEKSDWAAIMETTVIEGFNYSLIGGDFETGRELSRWFFDPLDNEPMEPDVNRYAHALKHALLGEKEEGKTLLSLTLEEYQASPTKDPADINYFTMSLALYGILNNDEKHFNEGLELQLKLYETIAKGEIRDTDEAYICENAVALANLGIGFDMTVAVKHDLMPEGLLLT